MAVYKAQQAEVVMVFNRAKTSHGTKLYRQRRLQMSRLLPNFPVGTEIAYKWSEDESLGTVIEHDTDAGRLLTNKKGSHDPVDIMIFKKEN